MKLPYQSKLYRLMAQRLSLNDIRVISTCLEFIDYESLAGEGKNAKILSLIEECQRRERINQLLNCIIVDRDDLLEPIQAIEREIEASNSRVSNLGWFKSWATWGVIGFVAILGIGSIVLTWPKLFATENEQFTYQLTVRDSETGVFLDGAQIQLSTPNTQAPKYVFTDNNGFAFFQLEKALIGQLVQIQVSLTGYELDSRFTTLEEGALPLDIRLEPVN